MKLAKKVFLAISCVALFVVPALGDDFSPPDWDRGDPFAITAHWEFLQNPAWPDPVPPDGGLTNADTKGSGSVTTGAAPSNAAWTTWDGDGAIRIAADEGSGHIEFTIDNIIDTMPIKLIQVQVTHSAGHGGVLDITDRTAFDNIVGNAVAQSAVSVEYIDPTHTLFSWTMEPNPDYEIFRLTPDGVQVWIDQVVVDTISTPGDIIPEPATLGLVGLGLLALLRRKRGCGG